MNKELEKKLYDEFPKLFQEKDWPKSETCMCWGVACRDGWFDIVHDLCKKIKALDPNDIVRAGQVKEKLASLRFYINGGEVINYYGVKRYDQIKKVISDAWRLSTTTCEVCGTKEGNIGVRKGVLWLRTLCDSCSKNEYGKILPLRNIAKELEYE